MAHTANVIIYFIIQEKTSLLCISSALMLNVMITILNIIISTIIILLVGLIDHQQHHHIKDYYNVIGWSCCDKESDSAPWLDSVLGKSKEGVVGAQVMMAILIDYDDDREMMIMMMMVTMAICVMKSFDPEAEKAIRDSKERA